ncbi:uncharacterized protein LOC119662423 isoform X1 [Teleopsis dalmanni]|uniref:uncharacterized protein LOC119662423 isoform X1 n=1 Tax=Teleopsis dalmanni TaxID=139649 RepID=UPI0018CC8666|nr:uncharacterized protein LOC119662423 isoform X1 [Teleopsis dalmanni]
MAARVQKIATVLQSLRVFSRNYTPVASKETTETETTDNDVGTASEGTKKPISEMTSSELNTETEGTTPGTHETEIGIENEIIELGEPEIEVQSKTVEHLNLEPEQLQITATQPKVKTGQPQIDTQVCVQDSPESQSANTSSPEKMSTSGYQYFNERYSYLKNKSNKSERQTNEFKEMCSPSNCTFSSFIKKKWF